MARHGRFHRFLVTGGVAFAFGCASEESPRVSTGETSDYEKKRQKVVVDRGDADFILQQIKIAESHAAGAPLATQIPSPLLPWGLRTVDGSDNNLLPGQSKFGAADERFPRLTTPVLREGEPFDPDGPTGPAPAAPTSYTQTAGVVADSSPRTISNLIVDQTPANPAAVAAAAANPGAELQSSPGLDGVFGTADDTPVHFLPNVAPDTGLSAPYNSWFTLFGQFFDHGLDLVQKGGSGTVFIPLQPDDPLFVPGSPTNFMVLSRATNHPGPDNVLGTADDIRAHLNHTTSFVDQNQTYTSHPSHQVFLRHYVMDGTGRPVASGKLLDGARGGIGTWAEVKTQARDRLGILLTDADATNVPLLATDPYGRFLRGPNGFAQIVTAGGLREGTPAAPITTAEAFRTGHPFLEDIAHTAVPGPGLAPDADSVAGGGPPPAGRYDDELLDAHYATGDGRGNENIGLTTVHFIFHAEHNRLVEHVKTTVLESANPAYIAEWLLPGANLGDGIQPLEWNGERLFQAARFGTEMQYQHLVFEEFARKVQPEVNAFAGYDSSIDPAIMAEFAHVVYRFGHSMLTETIARTNLDGTPNDIGLIRAFLNPLAFAGGGLDDREAASAVIRGMTRQVGNEIDEFVTTALRNSLLGLPLDLASINLARGRDTGIPPLNAARELFFAATGNSQLRPYDSWFDFSLALMHPESLVNFLAAYGTHPLIADAPDMAGKRAAATAIVTGGPEAPPDAQDFLFATGTWTGFETGLNRVDFWIGGLAEKKMVFGGLLGSTFNYVFETQLEKLQDGDRLYYLGRTAGMHFLQELEANSFSQLVMRNTSVKHLPFDIFSRPAFIFELGNVGASGPILDDPATPDVNEAVELVRMPDGTVRYTGVEHVVMGGTPGNDRMWASEGDDTLWGDEGNDRLEGGDGNDALMGGDGDDIITDLNGIDGIKGGAGHDVINAGPGLGEIVLGNAGNDFIVAGADPKETFGGHGDDYIFGGDSADIVFGGEGDDWIEGGPQADLLQGDNGNPFQDSPVVGHDVIIGGGGDDDYDSETGDDIMVSDSGVERHEGMLGFDWVTYRGDTQPANADLFLRVLQPPAVDALRDRFDLVEGLSGWDHDDVLRGDDFTAADLTVVDPTAGQNNALNDPAQIGRIAGLAALLPPGATSFSGGNILLGGAGSDLIEGRGGDDIIDGDRWLNVRISVRDTLGNEIATADSMGGVLRNKTGALALTSPTLTLQAAMFAGTINPGQLRIVREILTAPAGSGIDTAAFSDLPENYDIVSNADGSITVAHTRGTATDGTDTLRNIEQLQFAGVTPPLPVTNFVATAGNAAITLSWTNPAGSVATLVLRSTTGFATLPDGDPAQVTVFNGPGTTFTDINVVAGTTYFYTAFARDLVGNTSLPATASATPLAALPPTIASFTPTSGVAGTLVTITGTRFTGATTVRFGGVPASFTVVSATQINALVPLLAPTGTVSVTTPAGTGTSAGSFTVTLPAPVVSSFAPTSGTVGTTVTVAGSNFTGATAVTFGGVAATSFAVVSATQISAVVPTGATTGAVAVTTASGSGASAADFTVTVPPPVSVTFADNFDACTSSVDLGPNWTVNGRWLCVSQRARGEAAARIATANTLSLADTTVQARVQHSFTTATGSGVVARAAADGSSYYAARLLNTNRLQIVRVVGATATVLADVPAAVGTAIFRTLQLSVTGSNPVQLVATMSGASASASDASASRLLAGRAGLLSGTTARSQYDDFSLQGTTGTTVTPPPPPPPPPPTGTVVDFADNFDACTSDVDLGANWTISGRWYCRVGRARGEVARAIATANTALMGDTSVQARVNLAGTGATESGVVARAGGGGYYAARLLATQRLQIVRVNGTTVTVLADVPASVPAVTFLTLRLEVTGTTDVQLTAFFRGAAAATATDTSAQRLLSGQAGLLSGTVARTQYDDVAIRSL